jgi:hypothetical protein
MLWVGRLDHMVIVGGLLRAVFGHFGRKFAPNGTSSQNVLRCSIQTWGVCEGKGVEVGWKMILEGLRCRSRSRSRSSLGRLYCKGPAPAIKGGA